MGEVPEQLARHLAETVGLRRAVETGTYRGASTKILARIFEHVETIELSPALARRARLRFMFERTVTVLCGDSAELLQPAREPTFYWLDAHWSGGVTAGRDHECPVVREIRATSPGHPMDCYLIDDARFFTHPVPPPHDQRHWPRLDELETLFANERPGHVITVLDRIDVLAAVPRDGATMLEHLARTLGDERAALVA